MSNTAQAQQKPGDRHSNTPNATGAQKQNRHSREGGNLPKSGTITAERLLDLYDQVADAPGAVGKMRRFVLDLAVRGRLTEAESSDGTADRLLSRIETEKQRLWAEKKIKKPKKLPPVDSMPCSIPGSWQWTRIGAITSDRGQTKPHGEFTYLDVTAIDKAVGVVSMPTVLDSERAPSRARKIAQNGDVIYSCVRPYLLNVAVIDQEFEPEPIASTAFAVLNGHGLVLPWYIWAVLRGSVTIQYVELKQRGQAYPAINNKDFLLLPFPLPPLAEQHRIVAKVDELMALCDRLEAAQNTRETVSDRLTTATCAALTTTEPGQSGQPDAAFALQTFDALTTHPQQIATLRQTILDLAATGSLSQQKELDPISSVAHTEQSGIPSLRPGWRYCPLEDLLSEKTRNGYSKRPDGAVDGMPILRISAGTIRQDGLVAEEEHKLIGNIDDATKAKYRLEKGDLLACRFNGNKVFTGRLVLFADYLGLNPLFPDKLIRVRIDTSLAIPEFIRIAGESRLVRDDLEQYCATTVGNWGISATNLKKVLFPVPPLAEQHRIVAKVDELMALCDKLEAGLQQVDAQRTRLFDALLAEALV